MIVFKIFLVLIFFVVGLSVIGDIMESQKTPTEKIRESRVRVDKRNALAEEIQKLTARPCQTRLYFIQRSQGGAWWITCPGCDRTLARKMFPKIFIKQIELWAVDQRITLTHLFQQVGECPG